MNIKDNYTKQIDQEVKSFRRSIDKMRQSDNPYFTPAIIEYETKLKREELEKRVDEIGKEFSVKIDEAIEQQKEVAAKSYFKASETDKRLVDEYVSEFIADVKLGYSDRDKLDAYDRLESKLGYLDENGLHEVRKRLPEVFDKIGDDKTLQGKLRGMNATFGALQTAEATELDELKQAQEAGVDATFRRLRITHPAYSDFKDNRSGGNRPGQI